jgi:hypothetical protein
MTALRDTKFRGKVTLYPWRPGLFFLRALFLKMCVQVIEPGRGLYYQPLRVM